jgi:glycosyltransferase involved in cell wall biosynthesis
MRTAIHQFVPMLHRDDAVGRHTLRIRDVLRQRGIASNVYVEMIDPDTAADTKPFPSYDADAQRNDLLLYQFATASNIAAWLATRRETLAVSYHNVTPPELYAAWNNPMARHQLRAIQQLNALAPRTALAIAVSRFNEAELTQHGYARTAVVPPAAMAPTGTARASATTTTTATAATTATTVPADTNPTSAGRWLSVGRVAPNKGIELALMALLVTHAHDDPGATLQVVGRPVVPAYSRALERFTDELGLRHAVTFRGQVSDDDLVGAMATSDVLVAASQHEGFGVPVIEAMAMGLPVVANNAGALPEIVGDAGILVDARDPYDLAAAVERIRHDTTLRRNLEGKAAQRVAALDLPTAGDRTVDLLTDL